MAFKTDLWSDTSSENPAPTQPRLTLPSPLGTVARGVSVVHGGRERPSQKASPKMSSAYACVFRLYHQYVPLAIPLEPQERPRSLETPRQLDADENPWIQALQPDECDRL